MKLDKSQLILSKQHIKYLKMAVYYKPVVEHVASPGSSPGSVGPFPAEVCSADPKLPASFDWEIQGNFPIKPNIA